MDDKIIDRLIDKLIIKSLDRSIRLFVNYKKMKLVCFMSRPVEYLIDLKFEIICFSYVLRAESPQTKQKLIFFAKFILGEAKSRRFYAPLNRPYKY